MAHYHVRALVMEYKGNNSHRFDELDISVAKEIKFDELIKMVRAKLNLREFDACTVLTEEFRSGDGSNLEQE